MDVRVVEPRKHGSAVRVEHDGLRAAQPFDLTVRPHAQDLVAANRNGFCERVSAAGVDAPVGDDQIDGTAFIVALRADDEAGDERTGDDDDNDQCREPGRHAASWRVGREVRRTAEWEAGILSRRARE